VHLCLRREKRCETKQESRTKLSAMKKKEKENFSHENKQQTKKLLQRHENDNLNRITYGSGEMKP